MVEEGQAPRLLLTWGAVGEGGGRDLVAMAKLIEEEEGVVVQDDLPMVLVVAAAGEGRDHGWKRAGGYREVVACWEQFLGAAGGVRCVVGGRGWQRMECPLEQGGGGRDGLADGWVNHLRDKIIRV